jgi:methionyl-tRNA formyltransferase
MKIVFITPEEPSFLPSFFEKVVTARRDNAVGIVVVSPIYKNATWVSQALKFIRAFGIREFLVESFFFGCYKILNVLSRFVHLGRFYSIKRLAQLHRISLYQPRDVNAPEFLDTLRRLSPDLIISVSSPQIFRESLIELPTLGCINVHSSLLPKYRGVLPTFWVLASGEQETGVTIHYVSKGIDEGDIILQEKVTITPEETLHSLIKKCKRVGADLVIEAIRQFEGGTVSALPNPVQEGSYFSFPTKEDVKRFKASGRRMR